MTAAPRGKRGGWNVGRPKRKQSKGGCVDSMLWIKAKCGQGFEILKAVQTLLMDGPLQLHPPLTLRKIDGTIGSNFSCFFAAFADSKSHWNSETDVTVDRSSNVPSRGSESRLFGRFEDGVLAQYFWVRASSNTYH